MTVHDAPSTPTPVTHASPLKGEGLMPCCGRSPFDVPRTDRLTVLPELVTCPARPPKMQMCPDCRDGKHHNCAGFAFDADDNAVQCPCPTCQPKQRATP